MMISNESSTGDVFDIGPIYKMLCSDERLIQAKLKLHGRARDQNSVIWRDGEIL